MLLDKLKLEAGETIFEQSQANYRSRSIKTYNYTAQGNNRYQIKAIVKTSGSYGVNVNLDFNNNQFKYDPYCTCSAAVKLCEHATTIIYKFLADDFPKLIPKLIKPSQPDEFELLKQTVSASSEKKSLHYGIFGFDAPDSFFKITYLNQDSTAETILIQLLECLGNLNYSSGKREQLLSSLSGFDYLIFIFCENNFTHKDVPGKTISIPKSKTSLQVILSLIQQNKAISTSNSQPIVLGETLKPRIYLSGDESHLEFTIDMVEFELLGVLNQELNYVFSNNTLHLIDTSVMETLPPSVVISPEELGEVLFDILPKLQEKANLDLPDEFHLHRLILAEPEIYLYFDYEPGLVSCRPEVKLGEQIYRERDCQLLITARPQYQRSDHDSKHWVSVNQKPFQQLLDFFQRHHFEFSAAGWRISEQSAILKFIAQGLPGITENWSITTSKSFKEFKITPAKLEPFIKVEMNAKIDWFDFTIYYNLGGATYTHQEIMAMLRRTGAGNFIQTGEQWFMLEESPHFNWIDKTFTTRITQPGSTREKLPHLLYFQKLWREQGITINGNSVYNQFNIDISRVSLIESCPIPPEFNGQLRNYQKEGFDWLRFLHKYGFGGILADDMGLGKTVQVLNLIKSISLQGPVLIICPRSLLYNWVAEIDKFFPGTACLVYHGSPETRTVLRKSFNTVEIIISTYDIIVNDSNALHDFYFYYCILDEAQHIKNQQTQRARECKKINARYRLVLTGTPIENRLEDIWSLFDFVMPGYLEDLSEFKTKYVSPLKKANELESMDLLKRKITPFMLRRLKSEVLAELPPKIISVQHILMTQLQEDVYRTILKQVKQEILNSVSNYGLEKSRITVLAALTKLRQICDHPHLVLPEVSETADSGKLDALMELVNEAIDSGHKIIIFSQFVRMLRLIRAGFQATGINLLYLDGSTNDRMDRINCFNNTPEIPVFLISLKAGGVGINLTAADIVIHVDPWWNPMVEDQATDRVHRFGQQKQVMVYKLITIGSVEEKMIKLQNRKKAVFDAIIQSNRDPIQNLTWEDIKELLELE